MTLFCSSDHKSALAATIRRITKSDVSHSGIHVGTGLTFEARWVVGYYNWNDYTLPHYTLIEVGMGVVASRIKRSFEEVVREWDGKRYGVGQALSIGAACLLGRLGLNREPAIRRLVVCSEITWQMIDGLGGNVQRYLRRRIPDRDLCTPKDLKKFWKKYPRMFPVKQSRFVA